MLLASPTRRRCARRSWRCPTCRGTTSEALLASSRSCESWCSTLWSTRRCSRSSAWRRPRCVSRFPARHCARCRQNAWPAPHVRAGSVVLRPAWLRQDAAGEGCRQRVPGQLHFRQGPGAADDVVRRVRRKRSRGVRQGARRRAMRALLRRVGLDCTGSVRVFATPWPVHLCVRLSSPHLRPLLLLM
jgi:hypothetical protein